MHEARLRRIQEVTRHYVTLRGGVMRVIWLTASFFAAYGLAIVPRGRGWSVGVALLSLFVAAVLGIVAMIRVERWMDRRFGRVRPSAAILGTAGPVLFMAGTYADERYVLIADAPSIVFLGCAAFGAWLVLSLGRFGLHNLLPALVSLVVALSLVGIDDKTSFETWQSNAYHATALAWVAAGLIDLGLLWRTLGRNIPVEDGVADAS